MNNKERDLRIKEQCEEMIKYGYIALRQFPKAERHVFNAEIRLTMWEILRLIIVCNHRYHKKTTMQDLDAQLDLLRSQVRMAYALRYIDLKKYEEWSRLNNEIGKSIGGWFNYLKNRDVR